MDMKSVKRFDAELVDHGFEVAIVASRFNSFLVESLIQGAIESMVQHGMSEDRIVVFRVPGAWELSLAVEKLAASHQYSGIIVLGAIIRGATSHYDFLAAQAFGKIADTQIRYQLPIGMGLLTTETIEQGIERSGTKAGNKGSEAALACLEMMNLNRILP